MNFYMKKLHVHRFEECKSYGPIVKRIVLRRWGSKASSKRKREDSQVFGGREILVQMLTLDQNGEAEDHRASQEKK